MRSGCSASTGPHCRGKTVTAGAVVAGALGTAFCADGGGAVAVAEFVTMVGARCTQPVAAPTNTTTHVALRHQTNVAKANVTCSH